ncbi:MAG: hypothetical protein HW407_1064 [Bacteroidetes bacterium]|nr:hypothetical protein [Bacteroidota bacterium]
MSGRGEWIFLLTLFYSVSIYVGMNSEIKMPVRRRPQKRVTGEMKGMVVGESFLVDVATAAALTVWLENHGKEAVRRKENGQVRVWRCT